MEDLIERPAPLAGGASCPAAGREALVVEIAGGLISQESVARLRAGGAGADVVQVDLHVLDLIAVYRRFGATVWMAGALPDPARLWLADAFAISPLPKGCVPSHGLDRGGFTLVLGTDRCSRVLPGAGRLLLPASAIARRRALLRTGHAARLRPAPRWRRMALTAAAPAQGTAALRAAVG